MYIQKKFDTIQELSNSGKLTGILLLIATIVSLFLANFFDGYTDFFHNKINLGVLNLSIEHWINDGLMAIFFFMVGLEIKREILVGELSDFKKSSLSVIAAIGGVIAPAIIFVLINLNSSYVSGWAIPTATDIAFSLGVLSIIASENTKSLRIFLTALAIIDDLIAVLIIAIFFSNNLQFLYLLVAFALVAIFYFLNKKKYWHPIIYILEGLILWYFVFLSGIHSTIAGVMLALTIPVELTDDFEHYMQKWVNYIILPLFALTNTAIVINSQSLSGITSTLSIGISLGLILGKPIGIISAVFLATKLKISKIPENTTIRDFIGIACLAGIGFTMSIFISKLSFTDKFLIDTSIIAVILGSIISAILGIFILKRANKRKLIQ